MFLSRQYSKNIAYILIALMIINPIGVGVASAQDARMTFDTSAILVEKPDGEQVAANSTPSDRQALTNEEMAFQYGNRFLDYLFNKGRESGPSWLDLEEQPFSFDSDGKLQYQFSFETMALNYGNHLMGGYLEKGKEKGPSWLKTTDLKLRFGNDGKPVYSLETLQPLKKGVGVTPYWFVQGRYAQESDENATANIGLVSRKLSTDQTRLFGVNTFYDYRFRNDLQRIGLGAEYFDKRAEYRLNWYHPLSGDRLTGRSYLADGILSSYVRAVEGVDFEGGTSFVNAPWLKFYLGGYYYDNKHNDDQEGYKLRSTMQLTPRLNLELGYQASNRNDSIQGTIKYQFADNVSSALWGGSPEQQTKPDDMNEKLWQKVERDNTIKTETFTKFTPYTGNIQVIVTNSHNSTALVGATVQAIQNGKAVGGSAVTDAKGQAVISGLAIGTYTVNVVYGSYNGTSNPVTVTKDQTMPVPVSLAVDSGNAAIKVVNSQSQPVNGASVTAVMSSANTSGIKSAGAGSASFNVTLPTDSNGIAAFTNLPFGAYTFTVSYNALHIQSQSVTIAKTDLQNITILLPNSGGVISVTVKDSGATVLSGATVNLLSNKATIATGKTDAAGIVIFGEIAAGTYTLAVSADNYRSVAIDVTVTDGVTTSNSVTLTRDTGNVTVTLIYSDGQTSATPTFTLDGKATITGTAGTPTPDGKITYTFSNLTTGDHQIEAAVTGYTSNDVSAVTVEKGTVKAGTDINLTRDTGSATLTLIYNDGQTSTTPTFTLGGKTPITGTAGTPTPDGKITYTFDKLPTGAHTIVATATGYTSSGVSTVAVEKGIVKAGTEINLTRDTSNVTVTLIYSDGQTSVTPTFTLDGKATITGTAGTPTPDGKITYTFSNLTTGDHQIEAAVTGYTSSGVSTVTVEKGAVKAGTDIILTRDTGSVIVILIYSDGQTSATPTFTLDGKATITGIAGTPTPDGKITYTFVNLPTGSHIIVTSVDNYASSQAVIINVTKGGTASGNISLTRQTGSATITVDDGANPIVNATVSVLVNGQAQMATTDGLGKAVFTNIPTGRYAFTATKADYHDKTISDVIIVYNGNAVGTILLTRQTGNATITVDDGVNPIVNATVSVLVNGQAQMATTDGSGMAVFANIPTGTYAFTATKAGYHDKTISDVIIVYNDNAAGTISLTRQTGVANITVSISDNVSVTPSFTVDGQARTANAINGNIYSFILPVGNHIIAATAPDYDSGPAVAVEITDDCQVGGDIVLTRQTGTAEITVTISNNASITPDFTIDGKIQTPDAANGNIYTFKLPTGSHTIAATASNYNSSPVTVNVPNAATVSGSISLTRKTGSVTVFVYPGNPIKGATVSFTAEGKLYSGTTNEMGVISFSNIPTGTYSFTASKSGYKDSSVDVTIPNGSTTASIKLEQLYGDADIAVTDSNNNPISGAAVRVTIHGTEYTATTNASGVASFTNIESGTWTFTIVKSGYFDNSVDVTVPGGGKITTTVAMTSAVTVTLHFIKSNSADSFIIGRLQQIGGAWKSANISNIDYDVVINVPASGSYIFDYYLKKNGELSELFFEINITGPKTYTVTL